MILRLNRIPLPDTLIALILSAVGLILRALPGTFPVIYRYELGGRRGGSAFVAMVVVRRGKGSPSQIWEMVPYDFASTSLDKWLASSDAGHKEEETPK